MSITCLQETKLGPRSWQPSFPGYNVLRQDRPGGGGGLITLVHHSISFTRLASPINDGTCESLIIEASLADTPTKIVNVYVPPPSSSPPNYSATLAPFLALGAVVVGVVNAHEEEWSAAQGDARGSLFSDKIDNANYVVLNNPDIATRPISSSSPDIALVPPALAVNFDWCVTTTLNSDHLPVSLCFPDDSPPSRGGRRFTNFRKADWPAFSRGRPSPLDLPASGFVCLRREDFLSRPPEMLVEIHSLWIPSRVCARDRRNFCIANRGKGQLAAPGSGGSGNRAP